MKIKNAFYIFGLAFAFLCFSTCDFENPIIGQWWEEEQDYNYVAIIKDVPLLIYETIIETEIIYETIIETIFQQLPPEIQIEYEYVYVDRPLPPEILLQHIDIISIEFIIFSGNQVKYNWPVPPPPPTATSNVTLQEQNTNNEIVKQIVEELKENEEYYLILHGHANVVTGSLQEASELTQISNDRAESVRDAIALVYSGGSLPTPANLPSQTVIGAMDPSHPLAERITTRGYGGGRSIAGSSTAYAGLNRRVEAILFKVSTEGTGSMPIRDPNLGR